MLSNWSEGWRRSGLAAASSSFFSSFLWAEGRTQQNLTRRLRETTRDTRIPIMTGISQGSPDELCRSAS